MTDTDNNSSDLLSPSAVAARRNCSDVTVRAAIKRGDLPAKRVSRGKNQVAWLITPADADAWVPRKVGRPKAKPEEAGS